MSTRRDGWLARPPGLGPFKGYADEPPPVGEALREFGDNCALVGFVAGKWPGDQDSGAVGSLSPAV